MDKKIGILGLGSIGQRHIRELHNLGIDKIFALRTQKGAKEIPKELTYVNQIKEIDEFLDINVDGYIISNPTNLHIDAINLVKLKNKPIFVEKPVSNHLSSMLEVTNLNTSIVQVGFCLRYSSFFQRIKQIINESTLGNIYASNLTVGQYLPSWHPYTNYRDEYFSKQSLGGGALRTLSHEIDLSLFFFGIPKKSKTFVTHCSDLEINVDDYALVLMKYDYVLVKIEMDFISKKRKREGVIFGTEADLHYNFLSNEILIYDKQGKQISEEVVFENDMYKNQMEAFINLINSKKLDNIASNWNDSIEIMKIIEDEQYI